MYAARRRSFKLLAALPLVAATACGDGDSDDTVDDTGAGDTGGGDASGGGDLGSDLSPSDSSGIDTDIPGEEVLVDADITTDTTWTSNNTYVLTTLVFVANGATLTIEPGTHVLGDNASALVISHEGRLHAVGTATAPVVFTSSKAEGQRAPGDWGGVVLLGSAPINTGTDSIEGMEASSMSEFGGTDATHDCGILQYARIEFAGYLFGTDNELNGLTVGGCGSGTTLDHVQVHLGLDDGIEFFGGSANLSHAIISRPSDDGLDWDMGWTGNVQFLVVQQEPGNGDRGFECDNLKDDNDATPRSNPTIRNVTVVGSGANPEQGGMHLRRGTGADIANAIIMNFQQYAADVDGDVSAALASAGDLSIAHSILFGNGPGGSTPFPADDNDSGFDEASWFSGAEGNQLNVDPQLADPNNLASPDFTPAAGSPAADGMAGGSGFFAAAPYIGAVEPGASSTWLDGWTAFPEN